MLKELLKRYLPNFIKEFIRKFLRLISKTSGPTKGRIESNVWLRYQCWDIKGHVLSIGSGNDDDIEGNKYRNYFKNSSSYTTSDFSTEYKCDMHLDVRSMQEIADAVYDCIFCSGVLEHVDEYIKGLNEITRILKPGGILLLGLPFRQAIHMGKQDYWRFTEHGIRYILKFNYKIICLLPIDNSVPDFPVGYWVKAQKL